MARLGTPVAGRRKRETRKSELLRPGCSGIRQIYPPSLNELGPLPAEHLATLRMQGR